MKCNRISNQSQGLVCQRNPDYPEKIERCTGCKYLPILTDKHRAFGMNLDETSDHVVLLKIGERIINAFNWTPRTALDIQKAADDYLLEIDAQ